MLPTHIFPGDSTLIYLRFDSKISTYLEFHLDENSRRPFRSYGSDVLHRWYYAPHSEKNIREVVPGSSIPSHGRCIQSTQNTNLPMIAAAISVRGNFGVEIRLSTAWALIFGEPFTEHSLERLRLL